MSFMELKNIWRIRLRFKMEKNIFVTIIIWIIQFIAVANIMIMIYDKEPFRITPILFLLIGLALDILNHGETD